MALIFQTMGVAYQQVWLIHTQCSINMDKKHKNYVQSALTLWRLLAEFVGDLLCQKSLKKLSEHHPKAHRK
mgnify:CR=1 FL=1